MNRLEKEYHEFGPWLKAINTVEDIPQQFDQYRDKIEVADYSFKVPVHKDRRKLKPGNLLYEKVVSLFPDRMIVFSAKKDAVYREDLMFKDFKYIEHGGELMNSYIKVVSKYRALTLSYNSVSNDVSSVVVKMLRDAVLPLASTVDMNNIESVELSDLQLYRYFETKEIIERPIKILGYQEIKDLQKKNPSTMDNLLNVVITYKLQDALFMTDGVELIIANRRKSVEWVKHADYSYRHIFIPLEVIDEISIEEDPKFSNLKDIRITMDMIEERLMVDKSFPVNQIKALAMH